MEKLKELRERTGAGITDCKKALTEAGGDMDKAIEILRKKGIAKAAKRSDRETSEGIVLVDVNKEATEGYIIEINIETDFAAKSDRFLKFAGEVMAIMKVKKPADRETLLACSMGNTTVQEDMETLSGVIGEKIDIKRCAVLKTAGTIAVYSHMGGRIGVLCAIDQANRADLAKDIAMQVAAANPRYIRPEEVPSEELEKEKEIYRAQLAKEGKPENIAEKIMAGKVNKYFEEICLIKQEYIKDDKKRVGDILGEAKVEKFVRYSL